ncbi:MAG: aminotransferase class V-fold PLP-dependent enzyme, partial [Nitrospiraceae bacterium]|nr:aminotransferase class V-fold PLP-dependent enzyme [Nitrospiraceae bacterium]
MLFEKQQDSPAPASFRHLVKNFFKTDYCFLASSGRAALAMLLNELKRMYPGRNEVLLPAYTSFSVPAAVVKAGLKVSLYDLDPETLGPDWSDLERSFNENTLAVVACHLFGLPVDLERFESVAKQNNAFLIDDAAQAMGARYKGRRAGTFGDAGIFSMNRGKPITTVDGGIIITRSQTLADNLEMMSDNFIASQSKTVVAVKAALTALLLRPSIYWLPRSLPMLKIGASFFDPSFAVEGLSVQQAVMAEKMLTRLDELNSDRRVKALDMIERLKHLTGIRIPKAIDGAEPIYLRLPVFVSDINKCESPMLGIVP